MLIQISKQLKSKVDEILENQNSQIFKLSCKIYSSSNSEVDITPMFVNSMKITQAFTVNYMDDIELTFDISPAEYITLVNNHQDLRVALKIVYVDPITYENVYIQKPKVYQFKAIIKNTEDLAIKFHMHQLKAKDGDTEYEYQHATRLPIVLQLLDDIAYDLRHKHFHGIFSNTTLKSNIAYIASTFGIEQISLVEPDNTHTYNHINIPPSKDFSCIFDYLQNIYGVYFKGLEYYFTNSTLYIYPPYETDPKSDSTIHIYNVAEGQYAGLPGYHYTDNQDMHILSNSKVQTKNLVELGIEDHGNSQLLIRNDTILDNYRSVNKNKISINDNNTISCDINTSKSVLKDTLVSKYNSPRNPYLYTSKMAKYNAKIILLGWVRSTFMDIKPGHRVIYHFDDDGKYKTKIGICEYAEYSIDKIARFNEFVYASNAALVLRVEP